MFTYAFLSIRSVPIFKDLPEETLIKISDVLEEVIKREKNHQTTVERLHFIFHTMCFSDVLQRRRLHNTTRSPGWHVLHNQQRKGKQTTQLENAVEHSIPPWNDQCIDINQYKYHFPFYTCNFLWFVRLGQSHHKATEQYGGEVHTNPAKRRLLWRESVTGVCVNDARRNGVYSLWCFSSLDCFASVRRFRRR